MSDSELFQLKTVISRMHRLAVVNLETVMHLSIAISSDPDINPASKEAVDKAIKSIDEQIKVLEEVDLLRGIGKNEPE